MGIGSDSASLVRPSTRIIFLEASGSLTFEMADIARMIRVVRDRGIVTILDNIWATPLFFRPIEHRLDASIAAGTKYLFGYSDVMLGGTTALSAEVSQKLKDSAAAGVVVSALTIAVSSAVACARSMFDRNVISAISVNSPPGSSNSPTFAVSSIQRFRATWPCALAARLRRRVQPIRRIARADDSRRNLELLQPDQPPQNGRELGRIRKSDRARVARADMHLPP